MYGRKKLGEWLLDRGKITKEQLMRALEMQQQQSGKRLGELLVELSWITVEDLWQAQADQYETQYEPLIKIGWLPEMRDYVPAQIAYNYFVFPFEIEGDTLRLAMADPYNVEAYDQIRNRCPLRVEVFFSPPEKILQSIHRYYGADEQTLYTREVETLEESEDEPDLLQVQQTMNEPPIVRLVNAILQEAVERGASDIHFEPQEKHLEVRFRQDGLLHRYRTIPRALQAPVISRLKLLAEMDIAERRKAQDGRFTIRLDEEKIDLRASALPTTYGERIVMRLLSRSSAMKNIDDLGFSAEMLTRIKTLLEQPWGLFLVTGPTGSGKTTTLYACLQYLRSERRNILTCEDPVEYAMEGIGQSQVHERAGLTFPAQLRAILRQDPDVILVGEIRDQETAEIACRAAMTGHMVLSTLHTNDSVSAMPRLLDMGVPAFLLNSALTGVIAQRLVRRLCVHCKQPVTVEGTGDYRFLGEGTRAIFEPQGCPECNGLGYKGRLGIHELYIIQDKARRMVSQGAGADELRLACGPDDFYPMSFSAREKVMAGLTSVAEATAHLTSLDIDTGSQAA